MTKPNKPKPTEIEKFKEGVARAVKKAFKHPHECVQFQNTVEQEDKEFLAALTAGAGKVGDTTPVITVAQANRGPATFTFDAPQPIPAGLRFATFNLPCDLISDKLATGKSLDIQFFLSPDGVQPYAFANGTHWVSYGPNGQHTKNPDGTPGPDNPDPTIILPLIDFPGNPRVGFRLRGVIVLNNSFNIGANVSITS
jgi:hypothetical protein